MAAQENEHIQTLVAARNRELEHRRDVAKALAGAIDRARADEERLASVILVLHSQGDCCASRRPPVFMEVGDDDPEV